MAEMSAYCKAYLAKQFRAYPGWQENLEALRAETDDEGGETEQQPRQELGDEDILYLHDSYIVTDGVFRDEHVVFDQVDDAWKRFCHDRLDFEVPHYEPIEIEVEAGEAEAGGAAGDPVGEEAPAN
jgi:hypothetical protein